MTGNVKSSDAADEYVEILEMIPFDRFMARLPGEESSAFEILARLCASVNTEVRACDSTHDTHYRNMDPHVADSSGDPVTVRALASVWHQIDGDTLLSAITETRRVTGLTDYYVALTREARAWRKECLTSGGGHHEMCGMSGR